MYNWRLEGCAFQLFHLDVYTCNGFATPIPSAASFPGFLSKMVFLSSIGPPSELQLILWSVLLSGTTTILRCSTHSLWTGSWELARSISEGRKSIFPEQRREGKLGESWRRRKKKRRIQSTDLFLPSFLLSNLISRLVGPIRIKGNNARTPNAKSPRPYHPPLSYIEFGRPTL